MGFEIRATERTTKKAAKGRALAAHIWRAISSSSAAASAADLLAPPPATPAPPLAPCAGSTTWPPPLPPAPPAAAAAPPYLASAVTAIRLSRRRRLKPRSNASAASIAQRGRERSRAATAGGTVARAVRWLFDRADAADTATLYAAADAAAARVGGGRALFGVCRHRHQVEPPPQGEAALKRVCRQHRAARGAGDGVGVQRLAAGRPHGGGREKGIGSGAGVAAGGGALPLPGLRGGAGWIVGWVVLLGCCCLD
ncbi:MAG: hypothetical protein J3K34DRAFT_297590 [Monoraphidium minutum]|nr:MAG: hypothetical protein J3K34DRAFT_297590 [Monoraphidium minutum]